MHKKLIIEQEKLGDAEAVIVSGSITAECVESLRARLYALLEQKCRQLILDLSACSFLCSLGIGLLKDVQAQMDYRKGRFILAGVPRAIRMTLEMIVTDNSLTFALDRLRAADMMQS